MEDKVLAWNQSAGERKQPACGKIVQFPASEVSRTIADGLRTQSIGPIISSTSGATSTTLSP